MYINANVINRQFELLHTYIHLGLFLPINQIRTGKSLEVFWFIILFKLQYFTSIPKANSRLCRRGGRLNHSSCPSTLSLPAALDISHQSRPNRGGAC
jgi:hypothetical protein